MDIRKHIESTLDTLRRQIEEAVRQEQLRDQLTGLLNDHALTDELKTAIDRKAQFWIAFIEIDKFKSINDKFGYQNADALLKALAEQLTSHAKLYVNDTTAFRAHGDEFYLLGTLAEGEDIAARLGLLKQTIAALQNKVGEQTMSCTVSIGWLDSSIARQVTAAPTDRELRHFLECAVSEAKRLGRDRVVSFSKEMEKPRSVSYRESCINCHASFSIDIPVAADQKDTLSCPNCSTVHAKVRSSHVKIESIKI